MFYYFSFVTYCIRWCIVSRDSIVDADWLRVTDWCHHYNMIQKSCNNWGGVLSCAEHTDRGKDFKLILTVKMENRRPMESQFGSEFPAICNHCAVMMAWSRKNWKFCEQFLHFFGKTTLMVKFSKLCSKSFHCLTDRRC